MDEKMLSVLANASVLPRSEIYYMSRNVQQQFVFKQGSWNCLAVLAARVTRV